MKILISALCLALIGCASTPKLEDLTCDPGLGTCEASLEQEGYTWYVHADTECGVVTLETGEKLPFCGYKRALKGAGEFGIAACQACARK